MELNFNLCALLLSCFFLIFFFTFLSFHFSFHSAAGFWDLKLYVKLFKTEGRIQQLWSRIPDFIVIKWRLQICKGFEESNIK
jgi:hypothetical protein